MLIMNEYKIGEFAKLLGRTVSTLQRWDRDGILIAHRTKGNHRFYTHDQYLNLKGLQSAGKGDVIVYCRVPSKNESEGLERQNILISRFCEDQNIKIDRWIIEIGRSVCLDRLEFTNLTELIEIGMVSTLIIAHRDRLLRFGFEWFDAFCKRHGTNIFIVSDEKEINIEEISPKAEVEADILELLNVFKDRIDISYILDTFNKD
jgi:putative resolvase